MKITINLSEASKRLSFLEPGTFFRLPDQPDRVYVSLPPLRLQVSNNIACLQIVEGSAHGGVVFLDPSTRVAPLIPSEFRFSIPPNHEI